MDLGLPDTDGYTVTETIREMEEQTNRHTPIVALTAHTDETFKKNAFESGMDDFLTKPITIEKAKQVIDKYTNKDTA